MKRLLLLITLLLPGTALLAQLDNTAFTDRLAYDSTHTGKLYLNLRANTFLYNTEYFNNLYDGYTLFGAQLKPELLYYPAPHFRLQTGIYLRRDFGGKAFNQIAPTFTLAYEKDKTRFLMGTLEGSLSHNLIEPLYDFRNFIERRLENGAQFTYTGNRFATDIWIDWQRMQYQRSPYKESFLTGTNTSFTLLNGYSHNLKLALQGTLYHQGGQLDTLRHTGIILFNNISEGLIYTYRPGQKRSVQLSAYHVSSKSSGAGRTSVYTGGRGVYANAFLRTGVIDVMASYFSGHRFNSVYGSPLYRSESSATYAPPAYTEANRHLLVLRVMKDFKIAPGTTLTARLEPVYDFNHRTLEYQYSVFINFSNKVYLGRPKLQE